MEDQNAGVLDRFHSFISGHIACKSGSTACSHPADHQTTPEERKQGYV